MKVSAVIPAYNEEKTVGDVVSILKPIEYIGEVIVVSDGSWDETAIVAQNAGAYVIALEHNIGKGGAMMVGVRESKNDLILFLDADLIGLEARHVHKLIEPVLSGGADMTIGIFEGGRKVTDLAQFVAPFLSGQRVVKRSILEQIAELDFTRFGVEVALTRFAHDRGLKAEEVHLEDLTHVMKEEKLGLVRGFKARMKMYWEIAKSVSYNFEDTK